MQKFNFCAKNCHIKWRQIGVKNNQVSRAHLKIFFFLQKKDIFFIQNLQRIYSKCKNSTTKKSASVKHRHIENNVIYDHRETLLIHQEIMTVIITSPSAQI